MENREDRENVYTQFARAIIEFTNHNLTKEDLYNVFVTMLEMSNEDERNDRINYQKLVKGFTGIMSPHEVPYSTWK